MRSKEEVLALVEGVLGEYRKIFGTEDLRGVLESVEKLLEEKRAKFLHARLSFLSEGELFDVKENIERRGVKVGGEKKGGVAASQAGPTLSEAYDAAIGGGRVEISKAAVAASLAPADKVASRAVGNGKNGRSKKG